MPLLKWFSLMWILSVWAAHGAEPLPSEDEALQIGWPRVSGPYGTFTPVVSNRPLVRDLSRARKLWESECRDLGRAKGGSQAYRRAEQFTAEEFAKMGSHPGSWAGPIVADGMVFCASWRPCGPPVDFEGHPIRLDAEDFVVAIDARTGKTKWLTAEPGGVLRGGGKREGLQVSPVHFQGMVYSLGSTAKLFAHDAVSGKKLWESDVHPARPAQQKAREQLLAGLSQGKFKYDLSPRWMSSLVIAGGMLIVPDQQGGLLGVDRATGTMKWMAGKVLSVWASPSVWSHQGQEYVLCANDVGELRLLDPLTGKELWKLTGLGPNWFTLTPGREHVLVNVVADSGKAKDQPRKPGRLGAIKLSLKMGERAWLVGDGTNHSLPVWMDSGARVRVLYRDGRFFVPNCWQGHGATKELAGNANAEDATGTGLLLDEATGKALANLPAATNWNDQLSGLIYWSGDTLLARADSFHGPTHGGRHPWTLWSVGNARIERLPGIMDLSEFTNGYEVPMEAPLVGGFVFERTENGRVVCYDLRAAP